ncbi:hypothetical protein R1sor_006535 [Riccia sorocarpa]|uniref:Uncharacterized protein n=1 Tax=Riccia sorocarpa TaxID=122646 RepID=A0ABD3HU48_9MARC
MRSLSARGFSFSKLRKLSSADLNAKKKEDILALEGNSPGSEPSPSDAHMVENPYGSSDDEDMSPGPVVDRFDQNYLESRSNLLAYGKQMKRNPSLSPPPAFLALKNRDEGTLTLPPPAYPAQNDPDEGTLALSPSPAYLAAQDEGILGLSSPPDHEYLAPNQDEGLPPRSPLPAHLSLDLEMDDPESGSGTDNRKTSKNGSWLSRVRRSPRDEEDGSKSRRKIFSPR